MLQLMDTHHHVTGVLVAHRSWTKSRHWLGGSSTINCDTIGVNFTIEEGHSLFVR